MSKSPPAEAFETARECLAELKAAETFWETFEGNPNPPGQDIDVTQIIADAIYGATYDRRVELLLTPATTPAELHEKIVEIRLGGMAGGHDCWDAVMARLEADAAALAAIGGAA
ncbi:hypothetical protein [Sphingopyxis witflariensis]|uniref:Uncharacterized protein n=1 Tax=Sphingopyxis witflariensis TaxID=173675 RepID=A0A2D0ANC0_9SPHN|nr:hypothetical protein [Sphingopyxis witflariensis]OWQ95104.1 hypothetical protein CDQ91_14375 [Sphingopyxis witflariensis]